MKKKEHEEKGIPFDGEFYLWDYRYYDRKYLEETFSLDENVVKEYFPVSAVVPSILSIYQNLLGVRFEALKEASIWHPGWWTYCITIILCLTLPQMFRHLPFGRKTPKMKAGFLGYCYLDLFPRGLFLYLLSAHQF
jgi:hypothetical protein